MNTRLINAVIRKLGGRESLKDVSNHGASAGWSGFIYYSDTVRFYKNNRLEIVELVRDAAQELGIDLVTLVAGFSCLDDNTETRESIARCLYGRMSRDDYTVANALSWFALEEVANFLVP